MLNEGPRLVVESGPPAPALLSYRPTAAGRPWERRVLWGVLAVQALVVAFQAFEVRRYDAAVAPHMPTIADPDRRDWVTVAFDWGTIYVPPVAQFVLVPLAASLAVDHYGRSRVAPAVVLLAAALAVAAWGFALTALGLSIATFD